MRPDIRLPKIGIIQGCREYPERNEIRDELDQNWAILAEQIEVILIPIPNKLRDPIRWLKASDIEGVILSGGGDFFEAPNNVEYYGGKEITDLTATQLRCRTEAFAIDFAVSNNLKILGVCRGMQLLNSLKGGKISRVPNHVGLIHEIEPTEETKEFFTKLPLVVNSFHEYGIPLHQVGENFIPIACSGNFVEMFIDYEAITLGIMWHPERESIDKEIELNILSQFFTTN